MAGYRRFVAYVYEYLKGKKGNNCGFIKVEVRERRCRLEVHLQCPGIPAQEECRIYGIVRNGGLMDGSLLDTCRTEDGTVECLIETDALDMNNTGVALGRMGGLILKTDSGAFFGTEWDDLPIRPENFREVKKTAAEVPAAQKEKKESEENKEQRNPDNVRMPEKTQEMRIERNVPPQETVESETEMSVPGREINESESGNGMQGREMNKTEPGMRIPNQEMDESESEMRISHQEINENEPGTGIPNRGMNESEPETEIPNRGMNESKPETGIPNRGMNESKPEMGIPNRGMNESEPEMRIPNREISEFEPETKRPVPEQPKRPAPGRPEEELPPFADSGFTDCRRIQLNDLMHLNRRDAALRNNRFLQHGYYNFGHLLLCRRPDGRYILGVPGGYDQQERFMANMFGFPYFKESRHIQLPKVRGGYWYRLINTPDFH